MAHFIAVAEYKRRTGAHGDDYHPLQLRFKLCAQPVGKELIGFRRRKPVDRLVDIMCAHAGEHDLLDIGQVDPVVIQVFPERPIQRCHRIGGLDAQRFHHFPLSDSDNLGRRNPHIYTNGNLHTPYLIYGTNLFRQIMPQRYKKDKSLRPIPGVFAKKT